jgi:septal ring factor EnvC (AmiA/AmiB activator)
VVLSVVAGLLLAGAGVLGYLWWDTSSELDQTRTDLQGQVDELTGTVESRDSEVDQLDAQLQRARDDLSAAQTDLEGTENMIDLLEEQQDVVRECLLLAAEINRTFENGQTPSDAELQAADDACEETGRILGL